MNFRIEKTETLEGTVKAPPSKSYTHRAFILSSLSQGESQLKKPLYSEDTLSTLDACRGFGCDINAGEDCMVKGSGGVLQTPEDVLDLKNSGTTLRIITTMASLAPGYTVLTGDSSLRKRPMKPLLGALKNLGVEACSTRNNGMAPLIIREGFRGGGTTIQGDVSSQYISSILISAPYAREPVEVVVEGDFISQPYVDMTLDIMNQFQVHVEQENNRFYVDRQTYQAQKYTIEGDYSSASYIISAAAVTNSQVRVDNLSRDSRQGDKMILDIVEEMGAVINRYQDHVIIRGDGRLEGVEVNLENSPDLLPTMAVLGALAQGTTTITGVEHARHKETDRLHTTAQELSKLGVKVEEMEDGLIVRGGVRGGGFVKSHGDHRLAMALSLVGLKTGSLVVEDAGVHKISFPLFPETMRSVGCYLDVPR